MRDNDIVVEGKKYKKIDYLDEDKQLPNQRWVCVSFLSPEGIMNCTLRGLKIRGVFATKEEADEHAKYLHEVDPDFHVFVGEVGKWLPWDPEPDDDSKVKDQVYYESTLQDLMKAYKENRKKAQRTQEMRKKQKLDDARKRSENERKMATIERMQKKLKEKQLGSTKAKIEFEDDPHTQKYATENVQSTSKEVTVPLTTDEIANMEKKLKHQEELTKEEHLRLKENYNTIKSHDQKIKTIEESMKTIKELYEKKKQRKANL
jgi:hypothetical protein